jgi:hypothetical protein
VCLNRTSPAYRHEQDERDERDADDELTHTEFADFFSGVWLRSQYDDEKKMMCQLSKEN